MRTNPNSAPPHNLCAGFSIPEKDFDRSLSKSIFAKSAQPHVSISFGFEANITSELDLSTFRLAIEHPNGSDACSEEEYMSTIALLNKTAKLMRLCEIEGFARVEDILFASICDAVCPAICMTEGCDYTAEMEPDQDQGYCEACGGNTVTSALVLAEII